MNPQVQNLITLLHHADFEYPVAVYRGHDPELGEVLEVDAFEVPPDQAVAASLSVARVVWPEAFEPDTVLPGAFDTLESKERRASLPADTVWYEPRRTHAQSR